jgi:hypothetical protein
MHKNKFLQPVKLIALLLLFIPVFISCEYEFIEIDEPDPDVTISFSEQIAPIFSNSNCTGCHRPGATSPDLTAANAYNSIVPGLVDLDTPENSKIYSIPGPSGSHIQKYNLAQAALILEWIRQGAENN